MFNNSYRLTGILNGTVAILFFFPFVTIKCNNSDFKRLSGIELATGWEMGADSHNSSTDSTGTSFHEDKSPVISLKEFKTIDRNYFALAAFILAMSGLLLSLLLKNESQMMEGIIGLAGMMCLLLMRIQLDNSIGEKTSQEQDLANVRISFEYLTAYWLSIVCFLIEAGINMYSFMERRKLDS